MNTDSCVTLEIATYASFLPHHVGVKNTVFVHLHDVTNELAEDQNGMVTYLGTYPTSLMSTIELKPSCFCSHHISQHLHEFITNTQFCQILSERIAFDYASLREPFSVSFYVKVIREVRITLPSIATSRAVFQRLLEEQTVDSMDLGEEEETTCSICIEDMSESHDKIIRMPDCFHLFHQSCIFEWLKRQSSCPLCRRVPYEEDHETE